MVLIELFFFPLLPCIEMDCNFEKFKDRKKEKLVFFLFQFGTKKIKTEKIEKTYKWGLIFPFDFFFFVWNQELKKKLKNQLINSLYFNSISRTNFHLIYLFILKILGYNFFISLKEVRFDFQWKGKYGDYIYQLQK